ncbi:hypothetical protein HSBAA_07320 [Vreelandella sulfidaeris]|uniref:Di-trans,poly-cis-decaprenylcistransferase n=1 Tax=Vreelandella sulfidaeris TaxID=115553 RepID=A0A455U0K9_9GAMM|nr:hypothetical protein HSBAA_07320 [Halomonas sulfidaeris]
MAIIMDGNNRWARARGLSGVRGHRAGVETVRAVIQRAAERDVQTLSLFAFSSENWKRPAAEVNALMELFLMALKREVKSSMSVMFASLLLANSAAFPTRFKSIFSVLKR